MAKNAKCACEAANIGLYACAGGSNAGQMSNIVAVELTRQDTVHRGNRRQGTRNSQEHRRD
ncbi:MAG: hypothetical protein PWR29_30 [Methanolobus sp.]|jgi:uncharacterized metal-binding protein|nr:hypothetical protein [Methanolobus sp.]MDK2833253.1 hypothetical protein [Methanolobus sp.]MDK2911073.1 hypothetical protein [Methanolobus sp.]MDN5309020.1 hypothetical protein [Methanolobus sp.]